MRGPSRQTSSIARSTRACASRLAEVLEHQRRAPDRPDRVRDPASGDVGRGAVHGLEDTGAARAGGDAGARRHPHPALELRGDVGEDVAEEVRRDDDVEAERIADHPRGERVDEDALVAHVRMRRRDLRRHLVPEDVAVAGGVGLRRARDDAAPALGEPERVLDHATHARSREDARLDPDLELETLVRAAADACVLAFGVLADEEHVDRRVPGERGRDTFEQASRPQVRPEVEPLAQRQQQPPERDVVGDGGIAHGPEQHGIVGARDLERVDGHHRAGLVEVARPPGQLAPRHVDAGRLDDLARLGDDLGAGAVAGDDRDPVSHRATTVTISCGR